MSRHSPTPTSSMKSITPAPGPSGNQESKYILQVLRAELTDTLKKKSVIYVEIMLPKGFQVRTHTIEWPKLEWNRNFDFKSRPRHTVPIRVRLKLKSFRSDICLGEASISIGDLHNQAGQDYSLDLLSPGPGRRQSIGTLLLQLQVKPELLRVPPDLRGSRHLVENMRSKIVETLSVEYPDRSHSLSASKNAVSVPGGLEEPDGFEILNRIRNQLDSMKSGKLKMVLGVINAAAKIHPCVESSWKIVSSLHREFQKKARMDSGVIDVFVSMDCVLSYVEDVDTLKDKEQRFFNLIEESLRVIEACGSFILKYLNGNTKDRTRVALRVSSEERLSNYQSQLKGIAKNLHRAVGVHAAHRLEDHHSEIKEELRKIDGKLTNSPTTSATSSQPIIPPRPTEYFIGRDDYLKSMEDSFELPKTSVEMGKQRIFVLYGIGGVGKTQLALKFSDENRERFTAQYIIDASSHESIATSFTNIGRAVGIRDADMNKTLSWLSEKIDNWILIFDNADNRDVRVRPYFPNGHHGNILITTRNADYQSLAPSLEVSVLEESTAIILLLRTAMLEENEENREIAREITQEFGYLALAIVQAGSYIHAERLTLCEYHDLYERSRSSLLSSGPLKEELAYEQPVYTTWEISYAALTPFAKTMLDLSSFLYREGITELLWLRAFASEKARDALRDDNNASNPGEEWLSFVRHLHMDSQGLNVIQFRKLIRELRSYSLIQEPIKGTFSIHPLVHSWARERMESSQQLVAQSNAIYLLHFSLPQSYIKLRGDLSFLRMILPHLDSCGQPPTIDIAHQFALAYNAFLRKAPTTRLRVTMLAQEAQYLVNSDQNTCIDQVYLAQLCGAIGHMFEKARSLGEEQRRINDDHHQTTLRSICRLGDLYRAQGRWEDAERLFVMKSITNIFSVRSQ